jgi:hypothetical protein
MLPHSGIEAGRGNFRPAVRSPQIDPRYSYLMGPVSTLTFVLALCSAPLVDGSAAFDPGRVAPSFEGVTWNVEQATAGTVTRQTVSTGGPVVRKPDGQGYPAWYGFSVLVLALPEGSNAEILALGELAQRANEDRGLVVVTLSKAPRTPVEEQSADEADTKPATQAAPGVDLQSPSASLLAGFALDSSPWCPDPAPRAIVIGPSGEIVGAVRLMSERAALLTLLEDALNRHPAQPLSEDLGPTVREAQAKYFAGEWDAARKLAEKLAKKLERTDEAATSAARALVAKVEEQERALRAALVEANSGMHGAERLATIVAATRRGFPKGKAAEEAEAAAELQRKDMSREVAYRVAEAWVEALPTRPALFPEVADARGKRYAKELDGLTKMATFDGDLTRHAKNLLLRYELASQQPRR